ncbi:MAG: hypothetical protein JXK07_14590 [Spirochaetes bacterium]|nr:hypothetical protein [Spirochaetota bacterium]MBN2770222.1 hypothetical protein [Spirochaetota bacterium]
MSCCGENSSADHECCGGDDQKKCCSDSVMSPEDQLAELFVYKETLEKELAKVNGLIAKISGE